jgi:hypothetical protein
LFVIEQVTPVEVKDMCLQVATDLQRDLGLAPIRPDIDVESHPVRPEKHPTCGPIM